VRLRHAPFLDPPPVPDLDLGLRRPPRRDLQRCRFRHSGRRTAAMVRRLRPLRTLAAAEPVPLGPWRIRRARRGLDGTIFFFFFFFFLTTNQTMARIVKPRHGSSNHDMGRQSIFLLYKVSAVVEKHTCAQEFRGNRQATAHPTVLLRDSH
jgi:hypothetical protein